MTRLLNKISFLYDHVMGRFQYKTAKSRQELEQCFAIRKLVFGDELKRGKKKNAFAPGEQDQFDPHSTQIFCRDTKTGKIIGTVRIIPCLALDQDESQVKTYRLDLFAAALKEKMCVASRLAVLKEYRQSPAGVSLTCACYDYALAQSIAVSLLYCEPGIFPMYRRLGYKPLAKVYASPFGGYRLPLYLVHHDYQRLKNVGSPFFKIAKKHGFPKSKIGIDWELGFNATPEKFEKGFELIDQRSLLLTGEGMLFAGLSESAQKSLHQNAIRVKCEFGDVVLARDAGCKHFGVVHRGALHVQATDKTVIVLGEGDVFGEIAFLLNTPRSANVIAAADDTEITLFSLSAVKKIASKDDQARFWQNLARVLAQRLVTKNQNCVKVHDI